MKTISIAYSRADLVAKQRAAIPDLLVAAHADAAVYGDIPLAYHADRRWPNVYLDAVDQVLALFPADDVLILEGDIWPIAPLPVADWPDVVCRGWGTRAYPGILYRRAGVASGRCWELPTADRLPWRRATAAEIAAFGLSESGEIVGKWFAHWNMSERHYRIP
jgi:hypothetical protein